MRSAAHHTHLSRALARTALVIGLLVASAACGDDDDQLEAAATIAEPGDDGGADGGGGAGMPNPCELLPLDDLEAALGSAPSLDGPYDVAGEQVAGPFPHPTDSLTCIVNADDGSVTFTVEPGSGFSDACELGYSGKVEDGRCVRPDTTDELDTSGLEMILVDGVQVTISVVSSGGASAIAADLSQRLLATEQ